MKKLLSLLMVFSMLLCNFALAEVSTEPEQAPLVRYGITNAKGLNVRKEPKAKAKVAFTLPVTGTVVTILEDATEKDNLSWYKIEYEAQEGYVKAEFIDEVTDKAQYDDIVLALASAASGAAASGKGSGTSGSTKNASSSTVSSAPSSSGSETTSSGSGSVWIPKSGSKYHKSSSCSGMKGPTKVTLEYAKSHGYSACKKCFK